MIASMCCITAIAGCSTWGGGGVSNPFQNPSTQQAPVTPTYSQPSSSDQSFSSKQLYAEFQDIALPTEMSVVPGDSFIVQNGDRRVGILVMKGRVDPQSLVSFFRTAMVRDNWTPKGGFQYMRSIMIFEKPERVCIINIYEKPFYTYAEIYVAPTGQQQM
jgi:hypothetical protein